MENSTFAIKIGINNYLDSISAKHKGIAKEIVETDPINVLAKRSLGDYRS
jgi:hypothetical protein